MNNEIEESAKAVQEIAKTAGKAIEAAENVGGFIARVTREPVEELMGMVTDKFRFIRWRAQFFIERAKEKIIERGLEDSPRIVPLKLALPIIENASLEENDELQDLWANLLVSALDPNFDGTLRTAFIDILKQLEVIDVHILNFIYSKHKLHRNAVDFSENKLHFRMFSEGTPVSGIEIKENLNIMGLFGVPLEPYESSIDNLVRVGCVSSYVKNKNVARADYDISAQLNNENYYEEVSYDYQYEQVCLTSLGVSFTEACIGQKKDVLQNKS